MQRRLNAGKEWRRSQTSVPIPKHDRLNFEFKLRKDWCKSLPINHESAENAEKRGKSDTHK